MATYTIYTPLYLWWDADAAYTKDVSKRGSWWTELGTYTVVNEKYGGTVKAINHPNGYLLGWININDNGAPSRISTYNNFTIGNGIPVSLTRDISSFTHKVELIHAGTVIWTRSNVGTSITITLTTTQRDNLIRAITQSMSALITLRVTTYDGSRQVGSPVTKTVTGAVPTSIYQDQTITTSYSENVSAVASKVGTYVQHLSKLNLSMTASGVMGSTIRSYRMEIDGRVINAKSGVTDFLPQSGNRTIKYSVTDSRGVTVSRESTIAVLSYSNPTLELKSLERTDSAGNPLVTGTDLKASIRGNWRSLLVGSLERNSGTIQIRARTPNGSWVTKVTEAVTTPFDQSIVVSGFPIDQSYIVEVSLIDEFRTNLINSIVPTAAVPMSWGTAGIAAGKVKEYDEYAFESGGDALIEGDLYTPDVITAGGSVEDRLDKLLAQNVSDKFSSGTGVTGLKAYRVGDVIQVSFMLAARSMGWYNGVITTSLKPAVTTAFTIWANDTGATNGMYGRANDTGSFDVIFTAATTDTVWCSCTYITTNP